MSFQIIDTFTGKVLTTCETQAQAEKAESRLVHEPGEARYEIVAPTPPAKKKTTKVEVAEDVEEESNWGSV